MNSFSNLKTLSLNGIVYNKNEDLQSLLQIIAKSNDLKTYHLLVRNQEILVNKFYQ